MTTTAMTQLRNKKHMLDSVSSLNQSKWKIFWVISTIIIVVATANIGVFFDITLQIFLLLSAIIVATTILLWTNQKSLRYAGILLLIAPYQGVLGLFSSLLPNIITIIIVGLYFIKYSKTDIFRQLSKTPIVTLTKTFIFAVIISYIWSLRYSVDALGLIDVGQKVTLLLLLLIFAAALDEKQNITKLFGFYAFGIGTFTILSAVDFYLGLNLLGKYAQIDPANVLIDWGSIDSTRIGLYRLRGIGFSMAINRMALWIGFAAIWSFGCGQISTRTKAMLYYLLGLAFMLSLLATGSRSGIIGSILGIVVLLLHKLSFKRAVVVFLITGAIFVVSAFIIPGDFLRARFNLSELSEGGGRVLPWKVAIQIFLENPVFGVGPLGYSRTFTNLDFSQYFTASADPHNALLELLSQKGLVGTIPFVLLVLYGFYYIFIVKIKEQDLKPWIGTIRGLSISAVFICSFNTYQYERIIWFLLAWIVIVGKQTKKNPIPTSRSTNGTYYSQVWLQSRKL